MISVKLTAPWLLPLLATALAAQQWQQNPATGQVYALTPVMTWQHAEDHATGLGGHLATVRNQSEEDWLFAAFGNQSLWIGLTDEVVEGTFAWSSGEPVRFSNWAPGRESQTILTPMWTSLCPIWVGLDETSSVPGKPGEASSRCFPRCVGQPAAS